MSSKKKRERGGGEGGKYGKRRMYTKAYISTLGIVRVHFQTSFVTLPVLTLGCSIMYTDKNLSSLRATLSEFPGFEPGKVP